MGFLFYPKNFCGAYCAVYLQRIDLLEINSSNGINVLFLSVSAVAIAERIFCDER
jgi:hypothetical protein